jgi:hypothetical protein
MEKTQHLAFDAMDLKAAGRMRRAAMALDKDKAMRRANVEGHKRIIGEIRAARRRRNMADSDAE